MTASILVTGAGALLGQGLIRSLRLAKGGYRVVAVDPDPRAVGLYWADAAHLVLPAAAPDYLDSLCRVLEIERPAAVLVGTDVELVALARHREALEGHYHTRVIVSPPSVVRIADDKWLTHQFLSAHGLPHPRSALPGEVGALVRACGFPLVVKPRVGARSMGLRVVEGEEELRSALEAARNPIVQEVVGTASDEHTSGVLVARGKVHSVVTMRRELRDGNTYRAYVLPDSPFDPLLADVARKLGGFGPLNFQFRVVDGVAKIFEINARFSGTTPLRAQAGFNEVDRFLRFVLAGEPIPAPSLQQLVILRHWDEVLIRPEELAAMSAGTPRPGILHRPGPEGSTATADHPAP